MYICLMKVRDYLRGTMASKSNKATKQAKKQAPKVSPRSGVAPPVDKQFGRPGGNPRHNGAWKKEDTLRYKWEQIIKMTDVELENLLKDPTIGRVEKMTAEVLLSRSMKPTEKIAVLDRLATQVYGQPKQLVENHNIEYKPLVDLTKRKKNGGEK